MRVYIVIIADIDDKYKELTVHSNNLYFILIQL